MRQRRETISLINRFAELAKKSKTYDTTQYQEYYQLLNDLLPHDFTKSKNYKELKHTGLYLKGLSIRVERGYANPSKDINKARELNKYLHNLSHIEKRLEDFPPECHDLLNNYKQMLESYRIVLFAPELKAPVRVSEKKLKGLWSQLQSSC